MTQGAPPLLARLKAITDLLRAATPASTHDEAFKMLTQIFTAYEDKHSGLPCDPDGARLRPDGRLYPPRLDSIRPSGLAGVRRYRTRGHNVLIGDNGAVAFVHVKTGVREFSKPGLDGKEVSA